MTTVELMKKAANMLEDDAGGAELRWRARRLEQALRGRGGPVLAAVRRLNAPSTPGGPLDR